MREIRDCVVAVTGACGFLGSQCVNHLIEDRKCKVIGIDNLVAGNRGLLHPLAIFEYADIAESESYLYRIFKKHDVKFVLSYAAWPYIVDSYSRPAQVFAVNANGAINVVNAAHEAGCEAILQISSAELLGGNSPSSGATFGKPLDESTPVSPHSTYGAAKAAADFYCQCAWKERGSPVIILRQFNAAGPCDYFHDYVIPTIVRQLLQHPPKVHLGNNSERDFIYSGDQVRIAVELLEKGDFGEVYNLGAEDCIHIYDLAVMIGDIMGVHAEIVEDESRKRPWEIWSLRSCNDKLYAAIGRKPELKRLRDTIEETVSDLVAAWHGGEWK